MKRVVIAVVAAVGGFAGVLGFNLGGSRAPLLRSGAPASNPASSPPATTPPTSPGGSTTPTTSAAGASGPPPTGVRSAVGTTYQYGYGQLAVRVTLNGSSITRVATVGLQTADPYSQQLAQQVIPLLRHEVLAAQSAKVNGFSGATYTSEAYIYSLQSALDKLHKK
ncbi:MAG: FMN-binding protein [Acidimicrobiales bacterium]